MDLFKVIVFVFLLFCCLSDAPIEPRPNSLEHYKDFYVAMQKIDESKRKMEGRTVVKHNVYTTLCGESEVPLGEYVVGFDPDFEHSTDARKTYLAAIIRPEHVGTGKNAEPIAKTQVSMQTLRLSDDQIGHAIAKALGGSGGSCNLFAESGQLNMGVWQSKEEFAKKFLERGIQKDGNGKPTKDSAGKYQAADDRYVEFEISFEYPNDGRKDRFGDPYPEQRPSTFCYKFAMYMHRTDTNPDILAGCYLNESYLKRYKYDNGAGGVFFKDEPSCRSVPLSFEALTAWVPDLS